MIDSASEIQLIMTAGASQSRPFGALAWRKRLLVVFDQGDVGRASTQRRMLVPDGNDIRDLLVVEVPVDGIVEVAPGTRVDAGVIRRAYGITENSPFTVLLIGKDGGVKLRSPEPIPAKQLFDTIDAMPMRRREAQGE